MSERLLRPAVQRTEIGPIVSTIVPEVLEFITTEPPHNKVGINHLIEEYEYFGGSNEDILKAIRLELQTLIEIGLTAWSDSNPCDKRIDAMKSIGETFEHDNGKRLTFYPELKEMLREGLMSGVVMPLKLFMMLERSSSTERDGFRDRMVHRLQQAWFDDILHQLSMGPNGFIGNWSLDDDFRRVDESAFGPRRKLFDSLYESPDGSWRLKSDFYTYLEERRRYARKDDNSAEAHLTARSSGGCPVRHSRYKKIGEFASGAFEAEGIDSSELNLPDRKSSISLCREFVADRVEKIFQVE